MNIRVYQLAKELNIATKDLIEKITKHGFEVKNHMSAVDENVAAIIRKELSSKKEEKPKEDKPKAEPVKKVEAVVHKEPKTKEFVKTEQKKEIKKEPEPAPIVVAPVVEEAKPVIEEDDGLKEVDIRTPISVGELSKAINVKSNELIKKLMSKNIFASINKSLDKNIVEEILKEYGFKIREKRPDEIHKNPLSQPLEQKEDVDPSKLIHRAPVVTMMGHVDHGKTSLLDAIRQTDVASQEHGGITQHIGAYEVFLKQGRVVFLDTPGHAAFTAMRARGANVTDIVVLVVAADDGVMPQTIEAINHAKAANVPIVVAVNKVDKPGSDPLKVRTQLAEHGLLAEDWGGKTIFVDVSAITKKGVDKLLEMLLLESEMLELKANPDTSAKGAVVEAHLDKNRGVIATVLVQEGTIHVGDIIVIETCFGKIRALVNDKNKKIKTAGPATPVEILGLNAVPIAGDKFFVATSEKSAREYCEVLTHEMNALRLESKTSKMSLEDLYSKITKGEVKDLKLIVKADVAGSLEVIVDSILKIKSEKIAISIIHSGIGGINESDIMLASASDAVIVGFHVKPDVRSERLAEKEHVEIKVYMIIYELLDDVRNSLEGMLEHKQKEISLGKVEVRNVFKISKIGTVAGCFVLKGKITRSSLIRVVRDSIVVYDGKISSLKRIKDDAREVLEGYECGILIEKFNDIKEQDIIEAYAFESVKQTL